MHIILKDSLQCWLKCWWVVTVSLKKNQPPLHPSPHARIYCFSIWRSRGDATGRVCVRHSSAFKGGESNSCLIRVFGTLTSIVVALHRWVPANQPSSEHWSISTSCRLMSTRTTPLQDRQEDTINPPGEELRQSVQSEGCCASTCGIPWTYGKMTRLLKDRGGFEELTVSAGSIDTTHAKSGFEYRFQRQ